MSSSWELSVPADLFDEALKEVFECLRVDSFALLEFKFFLFLLCESRITEHNSKIYH